MTHKDNAPNKGIPMSKELREIFLFRLELLERNLRPCNGANEVHEVGNMRNVITGLIELLKCEDTTEECFRDILERLERQQVDFFKRKYGHLKI